MIDFTKDKRIKGWNSPSKEDLIKLKTVSETMFDKFNHPAWKWTDYPNGKPIYDPLPPTLIQTEQLRKEAVREEIRKQYTIEDEFKLHRENAKALNENGVDSAEYIKYNSAIEEIITESKKKDFQIAESKDA